MKNAIFSRKFRNACLLIAEHVHGPKGVWSYHCFDFINARYFANRLTAPTSFVA